jgi:hypothetical protein
MKAIRPLRMAVLALASCGLGMLIMPPVYFSMLYPKERFRPTPAFSWYFSWYSWHWLSETLGSWWYCVGVACLVVTLALSVVCLLRRDRVGVFEVVSGLSVFLLVWALLTVPDPPAIRFYHHPHYHRWAALRR